MHRRNATRRHESDPSSPKVKITREGLNSYVRLLRYIKPYRLWMMLAIVTLLLGSMVNLLLPFVIRNLVDVVFGTTPDTTDRLNEFVINLLAGGVGDADPRRTLSRLMIGLFIAFAMQMVFSFSHRLTIAFVGERAIADIRVELYTKLQRLSLKFYADHRTGEIVSRITNDVTQLQDAVTNNVVALLNQIVLLTGASLALLYLNWQLTLLILVGIPIISLTIVYLGRRIRSASRQVQDALAGAANVVEETTTGIRIVKSFAREQHEIGRFSQSAEAIYLAAMRRARLTATLAPVIGFMAFGAITATMWFGSIQVLNGNLTAGGLIAYLVYTMMVATPVSSLAGLVAQFQSALGATERLFELMDRTPEIAERPNAIQLPPISGNVVFDHVSFHYNDRAEILRDVSFEAQSGQIIALVGPSGAGKSTLVNLIPRFYDANSGSIQLDGANLRDVTLFSLRDQIGIVPQETILFSDTVANNIRYGKLSASDAEIEAAARAANAHDFILNELPDGYETLVGERGVKLSGGQRQRVAIARAILKDPRILILDEATSSLDSESERLVQDALDRLMSNRDGSKRTSFVIAHRLSTIVNADKILVLDQGQIVEQGTHSSLLKNPDGLYTRLHSMQFEGKKVTATD
ncbi:MAG: ABC transporter ATP-binding protein [Candidatus Promineifilaceae bacterium]